MARGNARARAALKRPASQYTPYALHEWPESDLRKEYTRLRDISVKRLKRMGQDQELRQTQEYKYYSKRMPKLRDLVDRIEIEDFLADIAIFVNNPEISTVGGARERIKRQRKFFKQTIGDDEPLPSVMTLQQWTYYCKTEGLLEVFASSEIVQYYYESGGQTSRLTAEQFREWLDRRAYWDIEAAEGPEENSGSEVFQGPVENIDSEVIQ